MAKWLLESISRAVEAGEISVSEAARQSGLSTGRIYRHLQREQGPPVIRHSDREREIAFACAAVILRSMSRIKKRAIPTHLALKELVRLGAMTVGELSVSRANRLMRALGISPAHMRRSSPCVRLQALGPNHLHEADFTHAAFVYLDNLEVRYRSELTRKPFPRRRVMLGVVKDHYSRCVLAARAYEAQAENTADTLRLLYDAWCPKLGTAGLPHGLPWNLYTDRGKFISKPVKALLKACFVSCDPHSPDNPRATGLAENTIKQLTTFQHLLKARLCQGASINLNQLNAWMQEWAIDQNAMPHPEFQKTTRAQVWQQIQDDDIRRCPPWDVFVKLSATRDEPRRVTNYGTIKLNNLHYAVGTEHVGEFVYPYKGPDGQVYVEVPGQGIIGPLRAGIPLVTFGSFRSPPLTESEKHLREVREVAEKLGYTPDDVEYERRTDEVFLPREGRPIVDDRGESERFYSSVFEAKSALADTIDLGSLPHEVVEEIERTLEDRADKAGLIPTSVVDEIARLVAEART